jgi:hypothetical protein
LKAWANLKRTIQGFSALPPGAHSDIDLSEKKMPPINHVNGEEVAHE